MRRIIILAVVGMALLGTVLLGSVQQFDKLSSPPTCSALYEGGWYRAAGGAGEGPTRFCICGSDGAATPAYAWCSFKVLDGEKMVCTGGSSTVCP